MISTKSKLAVALGVVGAIALSVPSADARTKRTAAKNVQSTVTSAASTFQPSYRGSYNFEASPLSGGINFRDGRNGANYNPNQ